MCPSWHPIVCVQRHYHVLSRERLSSYCVNHPHSLAVPSLVSDVQSRCYNFCPPPSSLFAIRFLIPFILYRHLYSLVPRVYCSSVCIITLFYQHHHQVPSPPLQSSLLVISHFHHPYCGWGLVTTVCVCCLALGSGTPDSCSTCGTPRSSFASLRSLLEYSRELLLLSV